MDQCDSFGDSFSIVRQDYAEKVPGNKAVQSRWEGWMRFLGGNKGPGLFVTCYRAFARVGFLYNRLEFLDKDWC
jgi:hypothetical protein